MTKRAFLRGSRTTIVLIGLLLGCQPQPPAVGQTPAHDSQASLNPELTDQSFAASRVSVAQVIDGDTLDLFIDKRAHRVRLKGINTPEKGECLSAEATQALTQLTSTGFQLKTHGQGDRGRLMGYLTDSSGKLIQEELVERGLALAYPYGKSDEFTHRLALAQERAEKARLGQFDPEACGPADVGPGEVTITSVDGNPEGDDLLFGEGESVTIEGPPGLSLEGWTLKDNSASHRLHFPVETVLGPRGRLVVFTSCGTPSDGRLHWCKRGSAVWNNGGDTAFLLDSKGNLVSQLKWTP